MVSIQDIIEAGDAAEVVEELLVYITQEQLGEIIGRHYVDEAADFEELVDSLPGWRAVALAADRKES